MIKTFTEEHRQAVINLWGDCGLIVPYNNPDEDITRSQTYANAELFLMVLEDELIGSVFVSHDARRGLI